MAGVTLVLRFELDVLHDAAGALATIHQALAKRHGDRFRALDRRIEAVLTGHIDGKTVGDHNLGEGLFILTPPTAWTEIIRDARALGVI